MWNNETRVTRIDLHESRLVSFMFLSSVYFRLFLNIFSFSIHQLISSSCKLFVLRSTPRGERHPSSVARAFRPKVTHCGRMRRVSRIDLHDMDTCFRWVRCHGEYTSDCKYTLYLKYSLLASRSDCPVTVRAYPLWSYPITADFEGWASRRIGVGGARTGLRVDVC